MKQTFTYEAKGMKNLQTEFLEFRQSDENWVPLRWKSSQVTGTINGSLVSEFALNGPVDPKEFELEFPPGTWVTETASPTTYIVKEVGKRRAITTNESFSGKKYEDFLRSETGDLAAGPDTTNDKAARAEALAKHRMGQLGDLQGRSLWSIVIVRQEDIEVRVEPVGTVNPREPIQVAVNDASCDQLLFGRAGDADATRKELTVRLRRTIEAIDQICGLADAQKAKLEVAGRVEIARVFRRADELRPQIKRIYDENAVKKGELDRSILELWQDSEPLRRSVSSDAFGDGSTFIKTLKTTLTPEQAVKYQARLKAPENPVTNE